MLLNLSVRDSRSHQARWRAAKEERNEWFARGDREEDETVSENKEESSSDNTESRVGERER